MIKLPLFSDDSYTGNLDNRDYVTPRKISVQTNSICNFACSYCYLKGHCQKRADNKDAGTVDSERLIELLSSLNQRILETVYFVGAELLATPKESNRILLNTRDTLGKQIEIVSNLSIGRNLKILLNNLAPKDLALIKTSLDGITEQTLTTISGRTGFLKEILDNIRYLLDLGHNVQVQTTVIPENYHEVLALIDHFRQMGVKRFSLHAGSFEGFADIQPLEKHIDPLAWRALLAKITEYFRQYPDLFVAMPVIFYTEEELKKYLLGESVFKGWVNGENTACMVRPSESQYLIANSAPPVISLCNIVSMHPPFEEKMQYAAWDKARGQFTTKVDDFGLNQQLDYLKRSSYLCPATAWAVCQSSSLIKSRISDEATDFYHACRFPTHSSVSVQPDVYGKFYDECLKYYSQK